MSENTTIAVIVIAFLLFLGWMAWIEMRGDKS